MRDFVRPRVLVSRCLEFENCRYNGQVIPAEIIRGLQSFVEFLPVCPEIEIGLGVPRDPIKLVKSKAGGISLVQPASGKDLTAAMRRFTECYLDSVGEVDGLILKSASPSCGIRGVKVYPGMDNPVSSATGTGMFASGVLERFDGAAVEDEKRLTNARIREHFLTRIFLLADFRRVKKAGTISALVKFQSMNKLMLMAYSQKDLRSMGPLVAGAKGEDRQKLLAEYEGHLKSALAAAPRAGSHINTMMHAFGYFSAALNAREKAHFLDVLEKYRRGRLPSSACLSILKSWISRFGEAYLQEQTYFEPYPEELDGLPDSGKGRLV